MKRPLLLLLPAALFLAGCLAAPPRQDAALNCATFTDPEARQLCLTGQLNDAQRQQAELERQAALAQTQVQQAQAAAAVAQNEAERTRWDAEAAQAQAAYWQLQGQVAEQQARREAAQADLLQAQARIAEAEAERQALEVSNAQAAQNWNRLFTVLAIVGATTVGIALAIVLGHEARRWLDRQLHQPQVLRETPEMVVVYLFPDRLFALGEGDSFDGNRLIRAPRAAPTILPEEEVAPYDFREVVTAQSKARRREETWRWVGWYWLALGFSLGSHAKRTMTGYRDSRGRKLSEGTWTAVNGWLKDLGVIAVDNSGTRLMVDAATARRMVGSPYPEGLPPQKPQDLPEIPADASATPHYPITPPPRHQNGDDADPTQERSVYKSALAVPFDPRDIWPETT